jgi:hypothetical protein
MRLHVVVRETTQKAWQAANDLMRYVTDDAIDIAQNLFSRHDSVGQRRMVQLHKDRRGKLEVSPNLWAGIGLVRGGAGTALVGDPKTVAVRIREYCELGIDTFIFSGYPHLEEAHRVAELLFPELQSLHKASDTSRLALEDCSDHRAFGLGITRGSTHRSAFQPNDRELFKTSSTCRASSGLPPVSSLSSLVLLPSTLGSFEAGELQLG